MARFLKAVAQGYHERYPDLSLLTFVMPNKRSGSFLLKEFNSLSETAAISPRIVTISEFIAGCASRVVDSRLDLLFRLFKCYVSLPDQPGDIAFENFYSWGETVLSDFNEIDMQMAEADEIFRNVKDLNSIRSNFLTPEQIEVMTEYFGYSPEAGQEGNARFWQTFADVEEKDEAQGKGAGIRKKFLNLWQVLGVLYKKLNSDLAGDGLSTTGGAYREAAVRIEEGFEPYPGEKIVFVGFNALSESERRIFRALKGMRIWEEKREPKADFIWDFPSDALVGKDDPAVKFIAFNAKRENFPVPEWMEGQLALAKPHSAPEIDVIAVPSNVMQAKIASAELSRIAESIPEDWIKDAKVAVILPDENLLLPLLYSLPDEYPNPNLTMGFPLRHTPVIGFASLLRRLHLRSRRTGGEALFFYEDVKDLLAHPYSGLIFRREEIRKFIEANDLKKMIMVSEKRLTALGESASVLFRYLGEESSPRDTVKYIFEVLRKVKEAFASDETDTYMRSKVETTYINTYLDALTRLDDCLETYTPTLGAQGVFMLAERLIAGETVAFEGEPLQGLQVMGVLETRCLDFRRVVMLSVNEKVMPRIGRNATFIPNAVRGAYGLPPSNYQEEIFAYYFFRVIGRAREAVLTYDSRSTDVRTTGPSRYLLQLKYLTENLTLRERETAFGMPRISGGEVSVEKRDIIDDRLSAYEVGPRPTPGGKEKNFSATALSHYFSCPLLFLYNDVLELYVERERIESIDAIDLGTIVHNTMESLYIRDEKERNRMLRTPIVFTADRLRALLEKRTSDGNLLIEEEARKAILNVHFHIEHPDLKKDRLRGSAAILLEYIVRYVRNIIKADIQSAPFRLWGCEIREVVKHRLPDGRTVRIKMVVDRLDQAGAEGVSQPFRIVDYKTGAVHLKAALMEEIFDGSYEAKNVFQLLLYAKLLTDVMKENGNMLPPGIDLATFADNLQVAIYNVPALPEKNGVVEPTIGTLRITSMAQLAEAENLAGESFLDILDRKLAEILDRKVPFSAEPNDDRCAYCDFRLRCELRR